MAKLFFSYSHRDEALRDELEIHLASLKRQGIIETWHDRRIFPGKDFKSEIDQHLEGADIILLLVSPYFIASDYCYDIEMKRALEKHESNQAVVIPVILHPCDWKEMPFGKLQACPTDGKPISKFPNLHDAFLEVTKAVKIAAPKVHESADSIQPSHANVEPSLATPSIKKNRSSNLRIKKAFTDYEKDLFTQETFNYIQNFFEESLTELNHRNNHIEVNFRRTDSISFSAIIYMNGKEINRCSVWLSDESFFQKGIYYSTGDRGNSYNESLTVENDGYTLYLKPLGLSFRSDNREAKLSFEGAAEYYWDIFIRPLQ